MQNNVFKISEYKDKKMQGETYFDGEKKKGSCVGVDSILIEFIGLLQDMNLLKQTF